LFHPPEISFFNQQIPTNLQSIKSRPRFLIQ